MLVVCYYYGIRKDSKNIQHYRINQKEIEGILGKIGYKLLIWQKYGLFKKRESCEMLEKISMINIKGDK